MKSPQQHTPPLDFPQAALLHPRASLHGALRAVGFNRTDPVIVRRAFNLALHGSGAAFVKVACR